MRILLGGGLAVTGVALLLMHGITVGSTWTTLLAGFIVGGIGIGLVNAPLASTSVSVVEPRRAGMASGINNTFRQVGIATGIAALGAIFQSQIAANFAPSRAPAVASGDFAFLQNLRCSPSCLHRMTVEAHSAFITGLNTILLVSAFVLFVGAILAFVLVRQQDFVESSAEAAAASG